MNYMNSSLNLMVLFIIIILLIPLGVQAQQTPTTFEKAVEITPGKYTSATPIQEEGKHFYKFPVKSGTSYSIENVKVTYATIDPNYKDSSGGSRVVGDVYEGGSGVDFTFYNERREELLTYEFAGENADFQSCDGCFWQGVAAEDVSDFYYLEINYKSKTEANLWSVNYEFEFSELSKFADLGSETDAGANFDKALPITENSYPECCSLVGGQYGSDNVDMFSVDLQANQKLVVKTTPPNERGAKITFYDGTRASVGSEESANVGAIVEAVFLSDKQQKVYFKIEGFSIEIDSYGYESREVDALVQKYGLDVEVTDVGTVCGQRDTRCSADFNAIETCADGTSWVIERTCPYGCAERGYGPECAPEGVIVCQEGEQQCVEGNVGRCQGGRWVTAQKCDYGCTGIKCNSPPGQIASQGQGGGDLTGIIIAVVIIVIVIIGFGVLYFLKKK